MKGNRFLFGIVVVLLLVTSVLPGCNKEPQLVIPSSLSPYEVFNETASAGPYVQSFLDFQGEWTAKYMEPWDMPQGATMEQFIEGYRAAIPEVIYIKRGGERAGWGYYILVVDVTVLKYENPESAERSFINISETQGLRNSTYEGIALKNGTYSIPDWEGRYEYYWYERNQPCYLIQSGCFVIHLYGREDIAKDILDRIIVAFGVKSSSNQTQAGNTT